MYEDCEYTLCLQPHSSTKPLFMHAEMHSKPMISIGHIVLSSEVAYLLDRKKIPPDENVDKCKKNNASMRGGKATQ